MVRLMIEYLDHYIQLGLTKNFTLEICDFSFSKLPLEGQKMFHQIRQDPGGRGPCPLPDCVHWLAFDERPRWRKKVISLMGFDMF